MCYIQKYETFICNCRSNFYGRVDTSDKNPSELSPKKLSNICLDKLFKDFKIIMLVYFFAITNVQPLLLKNKNSS